MNIRIDDHTDTKWSYFPPSKMALTVTEKKILTMLKEGQGAMAIAQELKLTTAKTEEMINRIDTKLKRLIKP